MAVQITTTTKITPESINELINELIDEINTTPLTIPERDLD